MARDEVTITDLALNTSVVEPTGTTINVTNGAYIDAGDTKRLLVILRNTHSSDHDFTFVAGGGIMAEYGDLDVEVSAAEDERWIILESSRFIQDTTGYIHIDFATGTTGTVAAVRLGVN